MEIEVTANDGILTIDETGKVLSCPEYQDVPGTYLGDIKRFNMGEFKNWYRDIGSFSEVKSIDILDIGFWIGDEYIKPCIEHRAFTQFGLIPWTRKKLQR